MLWLIILKITAKELYLTCVAEHFSWIVQYYVLMSCEVVKWFDLTVIPDITLIELSQ